VEQQFMVAGQRCHYRHDGEGEEGEDAGGQSPSKIGERKNIYKCSNLKYSQND